MFGENSENELGNSTEVTTKPAAGVVTPTLVLCQCSAVPIVAYSFDAEIAKLQIRPKKVNSPLAHLVNNYLPL